MHLKSVYRILFLIICFSVVAPFTAEAEGKVYKVLTHLLDLKGKHRLSPSLFERDAYQEQLRANPQLVSGAAFEIHWKAKDGHKKDNVIQIQIRGSKNYQDKPLTKTIKVKGRKYFKTWSRITLSKKEMQDIGKIVAWKVSLLDEEKVISEHFSFLWKNPPAPKGKSPNQPSIGPRNKNGDKFPR